MALKKIVPYSELKSFSRLPRETFREAWCRVLPRETFREAWCRVFRPDNFGLQKKLLLILFLSLKYSLQASPPPSGWIFNIYSVFSYTHYKAQPGSLTISFPYTLTSPTTNISSTKVFTSQNDDLIKRGKWVYPSIGIEAGKEKFSVDAQMGWYVHYWSDNLYGGVNYRFILKKYHASPEKITLGSVSFPGEKAMRGAASFPVKLSLGIFYFQPIWTLGNIDVADNQIKALGYTMQSLDTNNYGASGNVRVYFHQNIVALKPSFSIGFQPENNRLDINFTASPMIILSEVGGLRFYLNNNGNVDWVPRNGIDPDAVIPLDTFGLDATYKGEQLSSTPFHLRGWMFSLRVGVRIVQ